MILTCEARHWKAEFRSFKGNELRDRTTSRSKASSLPNHRQHQVDLGRFRFSWERNATLSPPSEDYSAEYYELPDSSSPTELSTLGNSFEVHNNSASIQELNAAVAPIEVMSREIPSELSGYEFQGAYPGADASFYEHGRQWNGTTPHQPQTSCNYFQSDYHQQSPLVLQPTQREYSQTLSPVVHDWRTASMPSGQSAEISPISSISSEFTVELPFDHTPSGRPYQFDAQSQQQHLLSIFSQQCQPSGYPDPGISMERRASHNNQNIVRNHSTSPDPIYGGQNFQTHALIAVGIQATDQLSPHAHSPAYSPTIEVIQDTRYQGNNNQPAQTVQNGSNPKTYADEICHRCHRKFTGRYGKGNLARHVRDQHGPPRSDFSRKCQRCDKVFKRTDAKRKHEWEKHEIESSRSKKRRRLQSTTGEL